MTDSYSQSYNGVIRSTYGFVVMHLKHKEAVLSQMIFTAAKEIIHILVPNMFNHFTKSAITRYFLSNHS